MVLGAQEHRPLLERWADEMRRGGYWTESQAVYEKLRVDAAGDDVMRWKLLQAYTDWHLGSPLRAGAVLAMHPNLTGEEDGDTGTLYRLLAGRVRLAQGGCRGGAGCVE
ncbi:MAG: hypothetical protein J6386_10635 [Candidatus Synoicihabitans palmerolidicus]|nr:hypothetical protein [Candidatus Synoicihabitans palmerolidicus]